tara:strand:+ start:7524 stop:8165 length:642 start_codon:yes stop_codon:yes gene_type:complete
MTHFANFAQIRDQALAVSNSSRNVHDHLKHLDVSKLQTLSEQDRLPWHTMCLNVTGDLNVGTVIRTSHCMGASSVIVFGRQKIDNRSLVGAANYIKVEKIPALDHNLEYDPRLFVDVLKNRNLVPVFVEGGGQPAHSAPWGTWIDAMQRRGQQVCLVMGNEATGIPSDILGTGSMFANSHVVSVPQRGVIRSLNVAVAHSMVSGFLCSSMEWM